MGQYIGHPTDTVERYGDLWEGGLVSQRMHWGTEKYVVTVYRPMTSVLTYNVIHRCKGRARKYYKVGIREVTAGRIRLTWKSLERSCGVS